MPEAIELAKFKLSDAVHARLQLLLDCQDNGRKLAQNERQEAQGLIDLAEFLSLLFLRSQLGQVATFHIDHIVPVVADGETTSANLALACVSCSLRIYKNEQ